MQVLKIKLEDLGSPIKIIWHSPCHAKREMDVDYAPKQLLNQLNDVEIMELEREDECCGFGGTFTIKKDHISSVMVKDKVVYIQKQKQIVC